MFGTAVAVIVGLLLGGCFAHSMDMGGADLEEQDIARIEPGVTTKAQVLDWFGQPQAIIRPGDTGPVYTGGGMAYYGSDSYFELFSSDHRIADSHRIYVYSHTQMTGGAVAFPLMGVHSSKMKTETLLILLDSADDIVDDYDFDRQ